MRGLAVLALVLVVLTPLAARAGPALDAFQSLCMATSADAKAVRARAAAQGFTAPPQETLDKLVIPGIAKSSALWKTTDGGMLIVIWGEGRTPGLPMASDACLVAGSPPRDRPEAELQAMLSVGPPRPGPTPLFVYADKAGARRALRVGDQDAAMAALSARRLRFVAVLNDANFTWISLMAPRG